MTIQDTFGLKYINPRNTETIATQRLSSSKTLLPPDYVSPSVRSNFSSSPRKHQQLFTQLLENEGCHLKGHVGIEKTPGTLHFFVDEEDYKKAKGKLGSLAAEVSLTHRVALVTFGNLADQKQMVEIFGQSGVTEFNRAADIPFHGNVNFCLYYFPLVPHMFSVGNEAIDKETYQYSFVYNCQKTPIEKASYQITFAYDFKPVGIYYNKEEFTVLQVFTSVSAIVTGAYVIMGMIKKAIDDLL